MIIHLFILNFTFFSGKNETQKLLNTCRFVKYLFTSFHSFSHALSFIRICQQLFLFINGIFFSFVDEYIADCPASSQLYFFCIIEDRCYLLSEKNDF
jgi:hypothetical protein